MHVAGACPNLPRAGLRTFGSDVSTAGLAAKCAIQATGREVSGSGMQVNIAGASLLQLDVATARSSAHWPRDLVATQIPRTALNANIAGKA